MHCYCRTDSRRARGTAWEGTRAGRRAAAIHAAVLWAVASRRYEGKIFRLAQHVTQNREDAEDVLQETFMKAYEHLDQFQGNSKFYTWIVRIAVNQALMKLRRRKTGKTVSLDETIDTGEDTVVREILDLGASWSGTSRSMGCGRAVSCTPCWPGKWRHE